MPVIRYALDPTGANRDNAVVGEIHTLSASQYRAIAPRQGPFFTASVILYDAVNNRPLDKGADFICLELLQEPTLKYGAEIAQLILIVNPAVSDNVRLSYQVLGGLYQNTADAVAQYYNTLLQDQRPVDWTNVQGKPQEFPPSLHNHLLGEIVGFEPVVAALERIRNAITLSDVPMFELYVEWVKEYVKQNAASPAIINNIITNRLLTDEELEAGIPNDRLISFDKLLKSMHLFHFNSMRFTLPSKKLMFNTNHRIVVDSTNMPTGTRLFWTIEHDTTLPEDFGNNEGIFTVNEDVGTFYIAIRGVGVEDRTFRIAIRKNSVTGPILLLSHVLTTDGQAETDPTAGGIGLAAALFNCCYMAHRVNRSAKMYYMLGDKQCTEN